MEVEVTGEVEIECECPKCGHKFTKTEEVTVFGDVDMSDYASHNEGYD
uniref:Uncharacterized protein n=1 Tax=viral metagenome TaxID=1070528 RepID=A0A6M3J9R2_9ZZZZ